MTAQLEATKTANLNEDDAEIIAQLFETLTDKSRVQIVHLLMNKKRIFVSDIAEQTGQNISSVSHHLKILRDRGFAKREREGKRVYYILDDNCIRDIMERAKEHVAGI